jgi:TolB-like protein/serine/threonine protein kinase/Tfp pilus assembly protein PilF
MISSLRVCPKCGWEIPADAPEGGCPGCLLENGLGLLPDAPVAASEDCGAVDPAGIPGKFGDFEITRREDGSLWELGRGGMGVTYRARDTVLHRSVALKVIEVPPGAGNSEAVRERFLREARAAAALRHPNVAAVYWCAKCGQPAIDYHFGTVAEPDRCYYAMELVEGETLEARVRREGPLKVAQVLEVGVQVTRALIAAANQGLIHRDLKPGNIMLTRGDAETAELEVKIIDFGLAKAIANAGGQMDLTHGDFVGTPNFASPEQFESGPVDVRSDIYSLGATLWFALTGKTLFAGRNIEEIRSAQESNALPVEQLKAARVPPSLRSLLRSMLAFEPAARPGIQDLAAQLRRCSALAEIEMAADEKKEIQLEIAHVLFIDIVGYSKLSINEEQAAVDELTQIVRSTEQFQKAEAAERLIKIPSGDGMALVFYTSPETPVRCAMQISRELKEHPRLQIRMGIHSGPVSGVVDVTGQTNLAGAGLNLAQRVMKCGDAGHILLSKRVAEDLSEFDEWRPLLHDLGTCEVKHGLQVAVVNLCSDNVGNRQLPQKFRTFRTQRARLHWAEAAAALVRKVFRQPFSSSPEKSIAVLPFANLSRDPDNAYFADGIQQEILTRLAKIADLKVISRTSTQRYQSKPVNLSEIAGQLGVANILEGSVQKAADQVRVNVQLINAATDAHLWAETYDRKLTDIFAVESEIATKIADVLQAKLTGAEQRAIAARPTENSQAYELYLRGRYFLGKQSEGDLKNAVDYFSRAIAEDRNYAPAYAGLAATHALLVWWRLADPAESLRKAREAAIKALEIDNSLAEAHGALALVLWFADLDVHGARRELERAIELNPNYAAAHLWLARLVLEPFGEYDQAISELKRAIELDPFSPIINANFGWSLILARRYPEAIAQLRKTIELEPSFFFSHGVLGAALVLNGQIDEGIGEYERAEQLHPEVGKLGYQVNAYARKGDRQKALQILERIKQSSNTRILAFDVAIGYAGLGDKHEAMNCLERSYAQKETAIFWIRVIPLLDTLHGDPRFEALAQKVLPNQ